MLWDRFVFALRVIAGLWVAAVTVISALQASQLMPQSPKLEPFAWVFSLVIIGVDSVGSLFANRVRRKRAVKQAGVEKALMSLLLTLSQRRVLRFEELSASVFVPTRWSRLARWLLRRDPDHIVLGRFAQFRPGGHPQQSGIKFTPAKGVVGECWRARRFTSRNLHALAERWGNSDLTEEAFRLMRADTRQGLSLAEFKAVASKYSEIAAEPIWHSRKDGKLVGVLTLDRPRRVSADQFTPKLDSRETQEQLALIARVVGGILHPRAEQ